MSLRRPRALINDHLYLPRGEVQDQEKAGSLHVGVEGLVCKEEAMDVSSPSVEPEPVGPEREDRRRCVLCSHPGDADRMVRMVVYVEDKGHSALLPCAGVGPAAPMWRG